MDEYPISVASFADFVFSATIVFMLVGRNSEIFLRLLGLLAESGEDFFKVKPGVSGQVDLSRDAAHLFPFHDGDGRELEFGS